MQQPKRFQAPTLAEAYDQVRRDLGDSAVILSTRKAFAPGLFGQPGRQFVEVVARIPQEERTRAAAARPSFDQDAAAHELVRAVAEAAAVGAASGERSGAYAGFQAVSSAQDLPSGAPVVPMSDGPMAPTPARAGDVSWSRQMDEMRGMLEQLLSERVETRVENGPASVRSMKDQLVQHGLPANLAASVLGEVESGARSGDPDALMAAVERRLAAKMPPAARVKVGSGRGRAIFLVGPSGAGKTTMAMRLALDLERTEGLRVVVAGTDVNRAGAPQQFMAFGAATGLDVRLCYTPQELEEILADSDIDAVIVDTAGHNGMRRDRMAELSAVLQVARQRTVLLALPATMKASDLSEAAAAFGAVGVDGVVLTRCDETAHFGAVAGVAMAASIGLAFTTQSDHVSDAPAAGDNLALAAAVVQGRWAATPTTETSSPATAAAAPARRLARAG